MTNRLVDPTDSAVEKTNIYPVLFFEAEFSTGTIYMNNQGRTITFGGNNYLGVGDFISVTTMEEVSEIKANGIAVTLQGIESSQLALVQDSVTQGKTGKIHIGFTSALGTALIDTPTLLFQGFMDVPTINYEGDNISVTISFENKLIDLQRARTSRYTHEEQKKLYSGDLGLEFVASLQDRDVPWGRKADNVPSDNPRSRGNDEFGANHPFNR